MHPSQVLALVGVCASMCAPFARAHVFDPIEYGAKGDGITDDTEAVRAALAAAEANNGGEVLFDARHAFLTGCFNVTSNIILNVKGTILASQSSSAYVQVEPLPWFGGGQDAQAKGVPEWQAVVRSYYASNITITGGGTIDGQGAPWWKCLHRGEEHHHHLQGEPCNNVSRPNLVMLTHTTNVKIYDIKLKDSPSWTTHLANCTNVHINRVTVTAPSDSPNTDGFDIDCSVNVLLENTFYRPQDSYYSGGDDAIAVISGFNYNGRKFGRTTENVHIRNLTIGTSHGISVGSEMSAGVRNVTFENITMNGSTWGIRMKSSRGRGGIVQDIRYSNIRLYDVKIAIYFTLNYTPNQPPTNATATPQFKNIHVNDVFSSGAVHGWLLDGLPESYISNASFVNIEIVNTTGKLVQECSYSHGSCENVSPICPSCLQ